MTGSRKLNWRQACDILGCSRAWFYSLIKRGLLPSYICQGKKRGLWVWERDVLKLVENRKNSSGF